MIFVNGKSNIDNLNHEFPLANRLNEQQIDLTLMQTVRRQSLLFRQTQRSCPVFHLLLLICLNGENLNRP